MPKGRIVATVVTEDTQITSDSCNFWGALVEVSVSGAHATFYNGKGTVAGQKVCTIQTTSNLTNPAVLGEPVYCSEGLYVDLAANVTEVAVLWEPLPK
jgi:hypothetical protein